MTPVPFGKSGWWRERRREGEEGKREKEKREGIRQREKSEEEREEGRNRKFIADN